MDSMDEREYIRILARTPPPTYSQYDQSTVANLTSFSPQPLPSRRNDTLYQQAINAPLRRQRIHVVRERQVPNNLAQDEGRCDSFTICTLCLTIFGIFTSGVISFGLAIPICCWLYKASQAYDMETRIRLKKRALIYSIFLSCLGWFCIIGCITLYWTIFGTSSACDYGYKCCYYDDYNCNCY